MKPLFVEIIKEQEVKVKDTHQQSTDKLVNKKEDDRKRR